MWKLLPLLYWSGGDNFFLAEGWIVHAQKQTSAWPSSTTKNNWNQTLAQCLPSLPCWKSWNNTQKLIKHLQYTNCSDWDIWNYLKLIFYLAGIGLWIQSADVVIYGSELTDWNGRVATETRLQNGIMDKHVLLLHRGGEEILKSYLEYRSWNIDEEYTLLFFLSHTQYAYLALFHVETNYTVCCVTALWAYSIHHWMWGLTCSFQIHKENGESALSGTLGQNGGGLRRTSGCKAFLFTRQWSGMDLQ